MWPAAIAIQKAPHVQGGKLYELRGCGVEVNKTVLPACSVWLTFLPHVKFDLKKGDEHGYVTLGNRVQKRARHQLQSPETVLCNLMRSRIVVEVSCSLTSATAKWRLGWTAVRPRNQIWYDETCQRSILEVAQGFRVVSRSALCCRALFHVSPHLKLRLIHNARYITVCICLH